MSQVSVSKVFKRFGPVQVIHGIDLEINEGELTVLLGPSGCGKSTLLRMIAGLEDISDGEIRIGGEVANEVPPSKRGCAMVFQNYALYPHQTAYKNMAFPLKMAGADKATIDRKVREVAAVLKLEPFLDRLPRDLSGGQRQRVAMGRAMIREPQVFLFDEPLSNLDAELRVQMRLEISRLQKQLSATMVFVTHDQVEAMTLADRIVVMREGVIMQVGAPLDVYRAPQNRFVAGFVGTPAMNFVDILSVENDGEASRLGLAGESRLELPFKVPEAAKTLGVRPEHVDLSGQPRFRGPVLEYSAFEHLGAEHLGERSYEYVSLPCGNLTILGSGDSTTPTEGSLRISFDQSNLHFFDGDGDAVAT